MGRERTKAIHPFIQKVMDDEQVERLTDLQRKKNLDADFLFSVADSQPGNRTLKAHYEAAQKLGMTMDEWVKGILGIAS